RLRGRVLAPRPACGPAGADRRAPGGLRPPGPRLAGAERRPPGGRRRRGRPLSRLRQGAARGMNLVEAYRVMALARRLDERMWRLARAGRAHFAVPCAGHEAIGAGYALALRPGFDFIAPHYRDLSAMLALGMAPEEALPSLFVKADDPNSAGRQPYAHWSSSRLRVLPQQGPLPNHVTHGVGAAWGSKLLGEDSVAWIAFGDGGAQKGEVHEAMNFAAIHRLPVVFCVENNRYTQSVPLRLESSVTDLSVRAASYGMPGVSVDGMDLPAVHSAAVAAIRRARSGEG